MLKGVCIGAGYFARFHYEAWNRIPEVNIAAVCDLERDKARSVAESFDIEKWYTDYEDMLEKEKPDFVDIITPPTAHLPVVKAAAQRGIHVICQKPLAPNFQEAEELVNSAQKQNIRLMVHENFRWQPWHREIKKLISAGEIGDKLHTLNFRLRQGDGWGPDAYLGRQPYFRTMPRLLVHETGIHFIDTFQFHAGDIKRVYSQMRKLNPVIVGEDYTVLFFEFKNGAAGVWDANRYNEPTVENPRYTFGDFLVEGNGGTIRLYPDGRLTIQKLGKPEHEHPYEHQDINFSGDCVYFTQKHFVDALLSDKPFETDGPFYLQNILVEEACYASAKTGQPIELDTFTPETGEPAPVV